MDEGKNSAVQRRLKQASESLDEAKILMMQDASVNFVMNSLYYALLYPVLGLLESRGIVAPAQGTAVSLFEREFVRTGELEGKFLDALHIASDLRPVCACEGKKTATVEDAERLLPIADDFLEAIATLVKTRPIHAQPSGG